MEEQLKRQVDRLTTIKQELQKEIVQLDDDILYQDFGVYEPQYNFAKLDEYKDRLKEIRSKQKKMISKNSAVSVGTVWKVNGSAERGKEFIASNVRQMIKMFNLECEISINKVKFSNYENTYKRIKKAFEFQNDINTMNDMQITEEYLSLKLQELDLSYEHKSKKQEEREQNRIEKELYREQAKVAREIEERRRELEKEQQHYENAMNKIKEQLAVEQTQDRRDLLVVRQNEIDNNLVDIDIAMKDLDYREANHRAGYVYIISNIGAFGENVYKIGMTRRLEPEDRIRELSGAAVPFKFDIHAMIFSNDAPALERSLHNAFSDKKINLVNGRKEFFRVSLKEIKKEVRKNYDQIVEFSNVPDAEQFRTSEMIRRNKEK